MCDTNCNNCRCLIKATSITTTGGVTTITIPDTDFSTCGFYCIGLFTAIPVGTDCTRVVITSGEATYPIECCDGNYWRPCEIKCRSILKLKFFDDPNHFILSAVKGRCR